MQRSRLVPVTSMNAGASRMWAYQRPPVSHMRTRTSSAIGTRMIGAAYDAVLTRDGRGYQPQQGRM